MCRGHHPEGLNITKLDVVHFNRERYLRLAAGVADGVKVDLSLVKLPDHALMFSSLAVAGADFNFVRPRNSRGVTKEFVRRARKLGFAGLRLHDLRVTPETLLLDAGCRSI